MKTQLSWLILASIVLLLAAVMLGSKIFGPNSPTEDEAKTNSKKSGVKMGKYAESTSVDALDSRPNRKRSVPADPKPWKVSPEVLVKYSYEAEKADKFYAHSDLGGQFREQGLTNFYQLMRQSLQGDQNSLARIFNAPTTDGAATEGFQDYVRSLLKHTGERYFAHELSKQPADIQRRMIWLVMNDDQTNEIETGSVPFIEGQKCYALTQLFSKLNAEQPEASSR